jgi:hypothetical protein
VWVSTGRRSYESRKKDETPSGYRWAVAAAPLTPFRLFFSLSSFHVVPYLRMHAPPTYSKYVLFTHTHRPTPVPVDDSSRWLGA